MPNLTPEMNINIHPARLTSRNSTNKSYIKGERNIRPKKRVYIIKHTIKCYFTTLKHTYKS